MNDALDSGYIPVVSTVAQGMDAETAYNINADTAAAKLAVALGAEKLILLTDVRGLLRDPKDEAHPDPAAAAVRRPRPGAGGGHLRRHDPQGGLLRGGGPLRRASPAIILDGRVPHSILIELLSNEGIGTMLVN